ncbi:MAG: imidazolonepropionase [Flavobacteriaceae bacterium]|nr:imidazolonepropionase [Flavobacteriaceae bacterium]
MSILITNIKELVQVRAKSIPKIKGKAMNELPKIDNAFLRIEKDRIVDYGRMESLANHNANIKIDATNKVVLPTWCDSHTHIVYASNRVQEFVDRINGLSYEAIAQRGGGILNSAEKLQLISEDELYKQSIKRVKEVIKMGTGALEIKSGYGLSTESELKMLRVIKRIKDHFPIKIKATFLGAHALPGQFKNDKSGYLDLIINEMLPIIAKENLAEYVDIFLEKGYFSIEDTNQLLTAAKPYGLIPKIHVNQFNAFGGIEVATSHKALSVDHLEVVNLEDIQALKSSDTMPVALPLCSFFLSIPYTPARALIDEGLALALASDYNPGSTPSGNMNLVISTACIKMKMTPNEAINAATINGAYAMGISDEYGSITKGMKANVMITKEIPNYNYLPYAFGDNHIDKVIINGEII